MPSWDSRGRAAATGSRTWTPPCIIGAAIMKMISRTKATSTSEVTLISALRCARLRRERRTLQPPLAGQRDDELARETLQLAGDEVLPGGEDVVGHHRGHRDREPGHRGDQG